MRDINWDEPLSDDDKTWLRQSGMPMVEDRIRANEEQFGEEPSGDPALPDGQTKSAMDPSARFGTPLNEAPPSGAPVNPEDDEDGPEDDYDSWKVNELKSEADSREPKVEYASDARKPDLIAALRQWDRDHPE